MKLLDKVKAKSFRKSKKEIPVQHDALAPATPAIVTEHESTDAAPVTPSPAKDSALANEKHDIEKEHNLRPLELGSFNYDMSYIFPSLCLEASSMLDLSMLIYVLSELRDLGKICDLVMQMRVGLY